jgi:UDP-N-acetylglucosamine--dolichyl-phosphate N-acetylglucosaminephosphotransferase
MIPLIGSLLAFMYYNFYPSQIFLGNAGSLMIGAGLGAAIVLFNLEIFGIIILIPHIINFVLWCVWLVLMKLKPNKYPHIKYAKVDKNNKVRPPNFLTVKYAICYFFKLTEKQAVILLYGLTIIFGIIGLLI